MRKCLLVASVTMIAGFAAWGVPAAVAQTATPANRDLSGVWRLRRAVGPAWASSENTQFASEIPLRPAAQEHCRTVGCARGVNSAGVARGNAYLQAQDPAVGRCAPNGFPRVLLNGGPMEIFQIPNRLFMRFYVNNELREIWTDGRQHPADLEFTWRGHSVGRWDGNVFVVDTTGILDGENGKYKWFDEAGHPHSDELHVVERIQRNGDTLQFDLTFEDPQTFTSTIRGRVTYERLLDEPILEYVQCEDRIFADSENEAWPFVTGDYPDPQFPPAGPDR